MHLGVIHWAFPPVIGGVEMHLLTVCPEMVRQGAEVSVLTATAKDAPDEEIVKGVRVLRKVEMSPAQLDGWQKKGEDLYPIAKDLFEQFLDNEAVEVVQAHNLHMDYHDVSRALADACRERDVPGYLVIHNQEFIDRERRVMESILRDVEWDRLVPISRFIEAELIRTVPDIPPDRYQTILHGIDLEDFHPVSPSLKVELKKKYGFSGRPVILHPARILPWKGILPAVKAIPRVIKKFPDVLFVFTGRAKVVFKEPEEVAAYNRQIDEFITLEGLAKNVHIGDYLHHDIPLLTQLAEVVIYTTIGDEPFGLCPVEAMAAGVPAVVTRSGGLTESVVDGETGYVISREVEQIPGELADRLIELLADKNLSTRMGGVGRKRAEEIFDRRRMARDFLDLSEELMREKKHE